MKNIVSYILLFTLVFANSGCNDFLTVYPNDNLIKEEFWKSKAQLQQAVIGCYRSMIEDGSMVKIIQFGEIRADNLTGTNASPTSDQTRFLNCNLNSGLSLVKWSEFYKTINNCNTVIDNADKALQDPTLSQEELNAFKAEAKGIRALMYFYLVRSYQEVPLVLKSSDDDSHSYSVAKSSEEEVLNQVIKDLKEAKQSIMSDYGSLTMNKGRLTRVAIRAILADVYLWKLDYQSCNAECDTILNENSTLALVEGDYMYNEVYNQGNSAESIFELQFDNSGKLNSNIYTIFGRGSAQKGNFMANAVKIGTLFTENPADIRLKYAFQSGGINYIVKYVASSVSSTNTVTYHSSSDAVNWMLYSLADVYLMKAEAMIELDKTATELIPYINKTYVRSNPGTGELDANNYTGKPALRELLRAERNREFLFQGKRWFDLIRYARIDQNPQSIVMIVADNTGSAEAYKLSNPNSWFLPVPLADITSSLGVLKQNPFYE